MIEEAGGRITRGTSWVVLVFRLLSYGLIHKQKKNDGVAVVYLGIPLL